MKAYVFPGQGSQFSGMVNHGMYVRYHHDVVGVNSRLDSIQAAILDIKLSYLDYYNECRKASAIKYTQRLANNTKIITPITSGECDSHVFHQYTLRIINADRDALVQYLNKKVVGLFQIS